MCDPVSVGVTMMAATAVSAYGQYKAGKQQAQVIEANAQNEAGIAEYNAQSIENAAEYNASVLEENAKIFDEAAVDSIARGAEGAAQERQVARQATGRARAARGSSGTKVDAGTNLDLQVQNAGMGEFNALTIMNNAEREAYGYRTQAKDARKQAEGVRYTSALDAGGVRAGAKVGLANAGYSAASTRYGSRLNAIGTLVTGASSTGKYYFGETG
nr:hypothetical protein 4 [bacterium]